MRSTLFLLLLCLISSTYAAKWSETTVSYLSGDGYKTAADEKEQYEIMTLQHASGWEYGDNFFFTDISKLNSKNISNYTEITSRFSSSKILKQEYTGIIKDYLLALNLETPTGIKRTQLYGLGLDLNLDFLDFLQVNFFIRDDMNTDGTSSQVTLVWKKSWEMVTQKFIFQGFLDYTTEEGDSANKKESYLLAQPQFVWVATNNFHIGVEQQFWSNKFGIKDLDESLTQLLLTWSL